MTLDELVKLRKQRISLEWLAGVASTAQERIGAGDLDFDDVFYRARDAALVLLDIFGARTDAEDGA
jgi:hypothetical protein